MPTLDAIIPEITNQIVYPSAHQIARKVLKDLGISKLFTDNLFFNNQDSASSDFTSKDGKVRLHENRCDVEINHNLDPSAGLFDTYKQKDKEQKRTSNRYIYMDSPIFADKRNDIGLFEMSVPCLVELNFTIKVKSTELIDTISTALYGMALSKGSVYQYNQIKYSYGLPDTVLLSLYKMFKLKDFGTSVVTFPNYLKAGSNSSIGLDTNRDAAGKTGLEMAERSVVSMFRSFVDVLGKLEYSTETADAEKENKVIDRLLLTFKYTFQMSKPTALKLKYPIMINNQMLPKSMTQLDRQDDLLNIDKNLPVMSFNEYFSKANAKPTLRSYNTIHYPSDDTWSHPSNMFTAFKVDHLKRLIALLQVDKATNGDLSVNIDIKNDIFPMLDVNTISAIDEVWKVSSVDEILNRNSIFNVLIFSNDAVVESHRINFDPVTYTISITEDISINRMYRLVITQFVNIKYLPYKFIYYMFDHHEYFADFLSVNLEYLINERYLTIVRNRLTTTSEIVSPTKYKPVPGVGGTFANRSFAVGAHIVKVNTRR